ncbi:outer membrane protein assembly factor BamE [Solimonas marina]|uniref:Outer membrane protein assembly factor BamE n=1 Tax=Solimonas marina TaxID=2714601 RepID=A0A969WE88_9GAMM|nr:outer membrane protein assembly factor BamE [Solimonas marina]NKF23160.1 outer membrane protein assembly factor BamE [Solimonas marina]
MRLLFLLSTALALSACSIIYKLPTRQGNIIEQKQLDQLKLGMTHEQVHYLMGTPIAASAFRPDRWDYVGYYKSPRGQVTERVVSLYFQGDVLARMDGMEQHGDTKAIDNSDVTGVVDSEKKGSKKNERDTSAPPAGGVKITPPGQQS